MLILVAGGCQDFELGVVGKLGVSGGGGGAVGDKQKRKNP